MGFGNNPMHASRFPIRTIASTCEAIKTQRKLEPQKPILELRLTLLLLEH
jgi:hypothetical protein